jgi:Mrp family chromosome partitioning ATPase
MQTDPDTEYGEAYRVLVANLDLSNVVRQAKTIMVTSATVGEGKTTATGNLGLALARGGRDVAIIDFDFHRPNLGAFFGLGIVPGVSDVLVGRAALSQASYTVHLDDRDEQSDSLLGTPNQGKLTVIPAGQSTRAAIDRLSAPVVGNLVAELRERFEIVLFDTPPLLVVSEGLTLSKQVEGMVIVTSAEKIAEPQLREMRQRLALVTCTPLGFIITGAEDEEGYSYRSYEPYWSNGDRPKSQDSRHAAKTRDAHA